MPDDRETRTNVTEVAADSPDAAFDRLVEGSRRFQFENPMNLIHVTPLLRDEMRNPKAEQRAFAAIVLCMDSRVSAELIFDQGLGDLFVVRSAGPMVSAMDSSGALRDDVIGCLEFAVSNGVKLIVILAHTQCGALKGAIDAYFQEPGAPDMFSGKEHLRGLVSRALHSVDQAKRSIEDPARGWNDGEPSSTNEAFVTEVARFHRDHIYNEILKSKFLMSAFQSGTIKFLKGIYDVETGGIFEYSKMEFEPNGQTTSSS